ECPAGLETSENSEPPAMRHGVKIIGCVDNRFRTCEDGDIKLAAHLQPIKPGRRHAQHRNWTASKAYRSSYDVSIAAELALPEAVADYRAGRAAALVVISRVKNAPENRLNTENIKEFAAHPEPVGIAGLAAIGKIKGGGTEGERVKALRLAPNLLPHGIGGIGVAPGHVSGTARICGTKNEQFLWIFHRHRAHAHGINQLEDGSIGANAERQRKHADGGEAGIQAQHAQAVANVLD